MSLTILLNVIVLLEYFQLIKILPIMLALCLMLSGTYYAKNYAGIIGLALVIVLCEEY